MSKPNNLDACDLKPLWRATLKLRSELDHLSRLPVGWEVLRYWATDIAQTVMEAEKALVQLGVRPRKLVRLGDGSATGCYSPSALGANKRVAAVSAIADVVHVLRGGEEHFGNPDDPTIVWGPAGEVNYSQLASALAAALEMLAPSDGLVPAVVDPTPDPGDRASFLASIKDLRAALLGQEHERTGAYRPRSAKDFAHLLLDEIPSLEAIWLEAARLGLKDLPEWKGEPDGKAAAVEMLDRLAAAIHDKAPPADPPKKTKGKHIDERMLGVIRDNSEAMYWSSPQWADNLGCGKSTVIESKTWKQTCRPTRERERLARGKRLRQKKPR
jgi:hypothetical protein